jgi:diguanylate cyclase (GGDEF)-like protein/PAS domain S-box-containing protein
MHESYRILLVEDDPNDAELLARSLARASGPTLELIRADRLSAAVELIAGLACSVILLDLGLPDSTGIATLTQMLAVAPDVPILVLTGHNDDHLALQAVQQGAQDFLVKGNYDPRVLRHAIDYALERHRLTQALRQREVDLAEAQRVAQIGSWSWDIRANHVTWSAELYRLFGVEPNAFDATFEAYLAFVHSADRDEVQRRIQGAVERRAPFTTENRIVRPDGSQRWVYARGEGIVGPDGQLTGLRGTAQDITDRKETEGYFRAFASLGHRLNGVTTPIEAARIILEVADQLMGWDAAYLDLYSAETDELSSVLNFDLIGGQRTEVPPGNSGRHPRLVTRRVIDEGGQLVLRSGASQVVTELAVFGDTSRPSESLMYVPVRNGPRISGILSIQSYTPHFYTPESLVTLQALADHVGTALDRIRAQANLQQSEARQRYLVDHANDLIYETDAAGLITSFNPTAVRLLGYSPEELLGRHYLEHVHPDQRTRVSRLYGRQFLKKIPSVYAEVLALAKDGTPIWLGQNAQLIMDGDQLMGFQVVARDITARRQAEEALTQANANLTVYVGELEQRNREISLLSDMGGWLQACQKPEEAYEVFSKSLEHLFPATSGALYILNVARGQLEAVVRWGEMSQLAPTFAPAECWGLRRGQPYCVEEGQPGLRCAHLGQAPLASALCVPMTAQGESLGLLHLRQLPTAAAGTRPGPAGQLKATQVFATTVVEQMALALVNLRLRETLRSQAVRDPLTGLFNRRYLEETLERELSRAVRTQRPFGVIMLDLDHFKRFNDTFGHPAGDAVLRELGRFLRTQTRGSDIACRYGGEEFTIILPECSLDVTRRRADEIREGVKRLVVQYQGQQLGAMTISLGVANYPVHGDAGEALLQLADAALYRAKDEGRDRVVVANARSSEASSRFSA